MTHYNPTNLTVPAIMYEICPTNTRAIDPHYYCSVEVGHYVKIRSECEYFWVQVREVTETEVTGEVYYKLGINPYIIGDTLTFKKCFMFDIYDPQVLNLIPGIDV